VSDFEQENVVLNFSAIIIAGRTTLGTHRVDVTRDANVEIGTQTNIAIRYRVFRMMIFRNSVGWCTRDLEFVCFSIFICVIVCYLCIA